MRRLILLNLTLLSLISCFEEDKPIQPFDRGDDKEFSVNQGEKYETNIFFNLEKGEIVKTHSYDAWTFGISYRNNVYSIKLNGALGMFAAISSKELNEIKDTSNLFFKYDTSLSRTESFAIGNVEINKVYVVNLGVDRNGVEKGFIKLRFTLLNPEIVNFEYAELTQENVKTGSLTLDNEHYLAFYSTKTSEQVKIAPPDDEWDLWFTQYQNYFPVENLIYNVNGVLSNPVYGDNFEFSNINYNNVNNNVLDTVSLKINSEEIGYDWKEYSFDASAFIVHPEKVYLLKGTTGLIYKLHFVGFYNELGEKGFPLFKYKIL